MWPGTLGSGNREEEAGGGEEGGGGEAQEPEEEGSDSAADWPMEEGDEEELAGREQDDDEEEGNPDIQVQDGAINFLQAPSPPYSPGKTPPPQSRYRCVHTVPALIVFLYTLCVYTHC